MEVKSSPVRLAPSETGLKFIHKRLKLKQRAIRVVIINEKLSPSGHICGTLRQIPLMTGTDFRRHGTKPLSRREGDRVQVPPFQALSYNWGSQTTTRQIRIDGQYLNVGENLWQFLNIWRGSDTSRDKIFIDQICIDQADVNERNHQVSIMCDVFEFASIVHVWLGPASSDSDIAMQSLHSISTPEPKGLGNLGDEISITESIYLAKVKPSVEALFNRPYWSRLWVVQEIILGGAHKSLVSCGSMCIPVTNLLRFFARCRPLFHEVRASYLLSRSEYLWSDGNGFPKYYITSSLVWSSLTFFFNQECSNILDRVYGLQGLLASDLRIAVDYNISADELFFRLVSRICFSGVGVTKQIGEGKNYSDWGSGTWSEIIHLIRQFKQALELSFPIDIIICLTRTEMKIRGVKIYDEEKKTDSVSRQPKDFAKLLRIFHFYWDRSSQKWLDSGLPIADTEPDYTWIPPPTYQAIRWSQKLRYARAVDSIRKLIM